MISYKFKCSHWWIFFLNPLQDLLSSLNAVISTNESTRIITGHVIYNPAYTYKFQLKTTIGGSYGNTVLYIGRAYHAGDLLPGKVHCQYRNIYVSHG